MKAPRGRKRNAKPVILQPRDQNVLLMLYFCDGLMSQDQIVRFFFADTHPKNANKRLLALFDNRYLNRNWKEEKWRLFPELIYWLTGEGYAEVAKILGINPDQSNKIARNFRPYTLDHHLQVVDVRLKVMQDVEALPQLHLGKWFSEGFFRSKGWQGKVVVADGQGKQQEKRIEPDGFFTLWQPLEHEPTKRQVFGFSLELDRGTETQQGLATSHRTTIEEKLRKGAAFLGSPTYRETFQLGTGRCLMVTTGWERAENMMALIQDSGIEWAWYFTTFEDATNPETNMLVDPIWRQADKDEPASLISQAQPSTDKQSISKTGTIYTNQ